MADLTKVILSRPTQWMNRLRGYRIFINGEKIATIKNGASEDILVKPGTNSIECKLDWCGSRPFVIDIKEGETVYLRVRSGMKLFWLFYIALIVGVIMNVFYRRNPDRPQWVFPVTLILILPALLYLLYYTTIGRKDYLVVEKDTKNIFA